MLILIKFFNDQGVILDSKLSFMYHVETITKRAWCGLSFLLRVTKDFRQNTTLINIYNTTVVYPIYALKEV